MSGGPCPLVTSMPFDISYLPVVTIGSVHDSADVQVVVLHVGHVDILNEEGKEFSCAKGQFINRWGPHAVVLFDEGSLIAWFELPLYVLGIFFVP